MVDAADQPVPVIAIGASAGGIQAFFKTMPAESGLALIVMLH
ncbi:hypothetical protein [Acidisoma silvae]|nr:hypothetical protein [Acidisoma silvae]